MRKNGSCRVSDYFKVQIWIPTSLAWRDLQKSFASLQEAREAMPAERQARVMQITERGRFPLP
jgi:hypothetical protein